VKLLIGRWRIVMKEAELTAKHNGSPRSLLSLSGWGNVGQSLPWGATMEKIKELFVGLFGSALGIGFLACSTLGWAYWMWMAIKLGSFMMFFFGILGPFALVAGVLGLWSFFFGIPLWLLHAVH
jgi:hypothetical protein